MKKKCIVMLSGGLDSRLVVKIMKDLGFDVLGLHFKLPFGGGCGSKEEEVRKFAKKQNIDFRNIDCSEGKLLKEYWKIVKKPSFGRGQGVNPCIDCRLFMLKKAKKIADKKGIDLIVTGEVLGERPMSQMKKAMKTIEKEANLEGRILRPLSANSLPEDLKSNYEKLGFIDNYKLYSIEGRKREKQEELAKRFNIDYPQPAGGCLLCEKGLEKRFRFLFKRGIRDREVKLLNIGRHFIIEGYWVVIGRNEEENKKIQKVKGKKIKPEEVIEDNRGPTGIILSPLERNKRSRKKLKEIIEKTKELVKIYSKSDTPDKKEKEEKKREFERFKI